jgi:peroxiredoxin
MKFFKSIVIRFTLGRAFTLLLLLFTIAGYAQQSNTTIEGKIDGMKPGKFIFYNWRDKNRLSPNYQSVPTEAKGFKINLNLANGEGGEMVLFIGKSLKESYSAVFIYVDKGSIIIHSQDSTFKNVTFTGSLYAQELNQYHNVLKSTPELAQYETLNDSYRQALRAKDTVAINTTLPQIKRLDTIRKKLALQWVNTHLNSPISVFILHNGLEPLGGTLSKDEQKSILKKLSPAATDNSIASEMLYDLNIGNIVKIGKQAPDFTQNDTLGKPVSLKDFRGKYVLLDFWASWCAPCRAENPNVVKAFNKFKDKGFTVLSVSLDQPGKKLAWLNAIHNDHLTWTHVSDLKFWGNAVAKQYGVNAVPANYLVGPDGIILAKDLHGEDLEKALEKYIKN